MALQHARIAWRETNPEFLFEYASKGEECLIGVASISEDLNLANLSNPLHMRTA